MAALQVPRRAQHCPDQPAEPRRQTMARRRGWREEMAKRQQQRWQRQHDRGTPPGRRPRRRQTIQRELPLGNYWMKRRLQAAALRHWAQEGVGWNG